METTEIILNYWKSWQSHSNWEETRKYLADDFTFDAGLFKADTADQIIEMMKNGNPWKEVELLEIVTEGNKGVLMYEGTDSVTGTRIRISEVLTVENQKITACIANITPLVPPEET